MAVFRGYGRASTDHQILSTEQQQAKIRDAFDYKIRQGMIPHDTVWGGFYRDEATGRTTKFREREAGSMVLALSKPGDIICASNFDRIFANLGDVCETLEYFKDNGIKPDILDAPVIDGAMGELFYGFLAILKKFERDEIRRRTAEIMEYRRKIGRPAGGSPPIGWKIARVGMPNGSQGSYFVPHMPQVTLGKRLLKLEKEHPDWKYHELFQHFVRYFVNGRIWQRDRFDRFYKAAHAGFPLPNGSFTPAPIPDEAVPYNPNTIGDLGDEVTSSETDDHASPQSPPAAFDAAEDFYTWKPVKGRKTSTSSPKNQPDLEPDPPSLEADPSPPSSD